MHSLLLGHPIPPPTAIVVPNGAHMLAATQTDARRVLHNSGMGSATSRRLELALPCTSIHLCIHHEHGGGLAR
jgi:hypothetical protein